MGWGFDPAACGAGCPCCQVVIILTKLRRPSPLESCSVFACLPFAIASAATSPPCRRGGSVVLAAPSLSIPLLHVPVSLGCAHPCTSPTGVAARWCWPPSPCPRATTPTTSTVGLFFLSSFLSRWAACGVALTYVAPATSGGLQIQAGAWQVWLVLHPSDTHAHTQHGLPSAATSCPAQQHAPGRPTRR